MFSVAKAKRQQQMFTVAKAKRQLQSAQSERKSTTRYDRAKFMINLEKASRRNVLPMIQLNYK
ncbi:hypothetical protein ACZ11_19675 [Lysinibacillus xylanilyticus]|uniref:Uncharacterized protein n=1 Tax=Lysinibacillus xylanilyticus TaxID=582475 RepID=A0A0K9F3Z3_9BACI|nr:hypothetical protein ACZ11_19675 [Lysinibacillus xylanilyticus]